jgi:streptogramin lyase
MTGSDGRIWFIDQRRPAVERMTTTGELAEVFVIPGGPNQWVGPGAIAEDAGSRKWFVEPALNRIGRITCEPA